MEPYTGGHASIGPPKITIPNSMPLAKRTLRLANARRQGGPSAVIREADGEACIKAGQVERGAQAPLRRRATRAAPSTVTSGVKSGGFERIEFPGDLAPRPRTCWQPPAPIHQACRRARAYQGQALRVAAEDAASLDSPCARRPHCFVVGTEECSLAEGRTKELTPRREQEQEADAGVSPCGGQNGGCLSNRSSCPGSSSRSGLIDW
jgi:hypothetical protein